MKKSDSENLYIVYENWSSYYQNEMKNMIEKFEEFVGKNLIFLENYDEFDDSKKINRKHFKRKKNRSEKQKQGLKGDRVEKIKKTMSQYAGFSTAFRQDIGRNFDSYI